MPISGELSADLALREEKVDTGDQGRDDGVSAILIEKRLSRDF